MATVKVRLPKIEAIEKKMGLGKGGSVQTYLDSTVARLSDPYVPNDTGYTRRSVFELSQFGSGVISYNAYWTNKEHTKSIWDDEHIKFQDAPMRGNFWVTRAMQNGGKEKLLEGLGALLQKETGGNA